MKKTSLFLLLSLFPFLLQAQSYVHASGKQIIDPQGKNLIIRSIGAGNWMLQEGYMMQTAGVAGTQWEFKKKLTETIGAEKTNQFYTAWLDNHFRRVDVDSMARWGFNCIRPALHYKLFTLPIEEEPVQGENTWLESGFVRLDSLVKWCADNKMYLILDMHGAPGGQGKDAAISDYDSSKPSLWESDLNKSKFVALWKKIAERYANNPWIAGYDLLNETNWSFPEGNNSQMRSLYLQVTNAIREVDSNHMIIIEGNWFANDFSGLTPKWDNNMAYSFHKYWATNEDSSIDWMINFRNTNNCPVWLGEAGENSNRWFTDCIRLMEKNNIGWSFWPVKKSGINNVMRVITNPDYTNLLNYWRGSVSKPTIDAAFNAVMTFAENHKAENCIVQKDVIDAMFRQPFTNETKPYKYNTTDSTVFATNYDFGVAGEAYYDIQDADYHVTTDSYTAWNNGYNYRNDGVDIESGCTDIITNGYNVGWIENGDWMQYTLQSTESKTYNMLVRYSGNSGTAKVYVEINGKRASKSVSLAPTGGWKTWKTAAISNIIVPAGTVKVKIVFEKGGVNLNYFQFRNPKAVEDTPFEMLSAETDTWENRIVLNVNKPIETLTDAPFIVSLNGIPATILSTAISSTDNSKVEIKIGEPIFYNSVLKIDYTTNACTSGSQSLSFFQNAEVDNMTIPHQTIPGKIEAENYTYNNGFSFETCTDTGNGINTSYAAADKYLDYYTWIQNSGTYKMDFRISVNTASAQIAVLKEQDGSMVPLKSVSFTQTGGWQNWQTQSTTVSLTAGKNKLRLLSRSDGYNLNWFQFTQLTAVNDVVENNFSLYPNPAHDSFFLILKDQASAKCELFDIQGRKMFETIAKKSPEKIDIQGFSPGIYIMKLTGGKSTETKKIQVI